MSPCIENAIHWPSGLHAGSLGPVVTSGNRCRSTRSEKPKRDGPASRTTPAIASATIPAVARVRVMTRWIIPVIAAAALAQTPASPLLNPEAPQFKTPAPAVCVVRLETTKGNIDIEVTRDWAPRSADRFINLVRAGYY